MPPYEWPAAGDLHGVQRPPPISDPPTLRDLSNVYDYPNETLGRLVLLENKLCQAVPNDPALPEPQGVDAVLQLIQQTHAELLATINGVRDDTAAAALRIEEKIDDLKTESRQNYTAIAKVLNSMQPIGPRIPLLSVPFANNELPPRNLDVLRDRFTVLNLSSRQRKRYYRGYYPDGNIADQDEIGQTRAILQAIGCKLVEGELEG